MQHYTFTCPLEGCNHVVMHASATTAEEAATELTATAEQHLQTMHPEIHKTHEEVDQDIRSHMTQVTS